MLFLVLAEDKLGLGADGLGLLLSALGVGGVLIAPLVSRVAGSRRLATIISLAMIAFTRPTAVLAVTALQRSLPPEMIARVFGIFGSLSLGAVALGALVMPVSLNLLGLDGTLLLVSVGASALVVLAYPFTRRVDRELSDRLAALEPRIAALSGLGIFSAASRTMLERLAGAAEEVSVPAGTRIITQGEPADAFYVITDGAVAVSKTLEDGTQRLIQTLEAGEFFGEIGLLEAGERTANVDADGEVALLKLPGEEFISALTEAPPTTAFLEVTRMRLATTDPARRLTTKAIQPDEG